MSAQRATKAFRVPSLVFAVAMASCVRSKPALETAVTVDDAAVDALSVAQLDARKDLGTEIATLDSATDETRDASLDASGDDASDVVLADVVTSDAPPCGWYTGDRKGWICTPGHFCALYSERACVFAQRSSAGNPATCTPCRIDRERGIAPLHGMFPWTYVFARREGAGVFASPEAASSDDGTPQTRYHQGRVGFAFEPNQSRRGEYLRTTDGLFLRPEEIYGASVPRFSGVILGEEVPLPRGDWGWVAASSAPTFRADGSPHPTGTLVHLTRVSVLERKDTLARIGDDRWVRLTDLRIPTMGPFPTEIPIDSGARWVDVERASQTLVAWEGRTAVFATVVSTGMDQMETHPGVFRVKTRYAAYTMRNPPYLPAVMNYRFENVPFVQFFDGDRALHGVYWHDEFGYRRSHGCVNLSVRDAAFLYDFLRTDPRNPDATAWVRVR